MTSECNLPKIQRIVTHHNSQGVGAVQFHDTVDFKNVDNLFLKELPAVPGAKSAPLWITENLPADDNNKSYLYCDDGALRTFDRTSNLGIVVQPAGINFQSTDLAPRAETIMATSNERERKPIQLLHLLTPRQSLDYNILLEGEVILIMEDGSETHLKTPGDTGTNHAWRNPTDKWARWHSVILAAAPAMINGQALPSFPESEQ
ncbi:hypothetical protein DL96DRAFT_1702307 [Flagelloscypha sp. PMI_526]|nr:hypothetical protein DL96DRAFT_1702307 [Flagelloscypha sp. PMI_526]